MILVANDISDGARKLPFCRHIVDN